MKSQYLIWIILFLVYMVFIFLKKTRAASKPEERGGGRSRPGLQGKLDKFLSRIKAEIEAANPKGSNEETGWEEYLPQEEDVKTLRDESPPERIEPVIEKKPVLKVKPVVDGKKTLPGLEFGIRDLRMAVVWSEILAPPLALRDE
jgi:hypothetical protein